MNFEFPKSAIKNGPAAAFSAANGEKEGWQLVAPGLAWIEFKDPAESLYLVPSQRGKGRKYAVITWEPGQKNSASVYLVNSVRKLDKASRVITGQELAAMLEPAKKADKPAAEAEEKKPAQKPAATKKTSKPVKAVKTTKKPASQASEKKPVKAVKTSQPATGLQFGPALVSDKGKITIASLLHAEKVFASREVPADFEERFKKYSEDNRLLLYLQGGPGLGQVSTYRGWLKQGRQVTKGQHGLKILAPRMVADEKGNPKIDGLRLVTLFSVDQTELAKEEA